MSITDELRVFRPEIDGCKLMRPCDEKKLLAIADRIDAEHEKAVCEAYANGMDVAKTMTECMVELPKDADDVPWKVGDRDEDGNVVTELRLTYDGCWFVITDGEWPYRPKRKRHHHDHHTPNVEDVLREFICDHEEGVRDEVDLIAEYAAKLRLVEGEDE